MKRTIRLQEDISINQILKDYESEIYDSILNSVKENFKKSEKSEVNVVNITTQTRNYTINLTREKFIKWLNKCIAFFETLEEYEKCQECVNIIKEIENNDKKQLTY